ncbi:hypothetical protein MJO28_001700 [Puccinia striiformis f. sp. tritici]|uniref:2,4-dienoyl-CoA reductase [(3E)-enoyl-CoA-producing] n=3 Tax=Puccinia striiformis f. sp. tritici TaxID=168172 RepID=A0A0L0W4N9_9BASI|nr:hypothetical protein Pst134EA_003059 [Puccinia striiformis f. sp. tritici]KAI9629660.1 hypothetical protein KEM48_012724 [Puccinia striiformis f. sp. tritici PST-130]KNF06471.1 hypothetical protein PSTG_00350 [Puccinia striiformis f. sp. tritici PST-78]KAH9472445.1 hypothetical protein Pst134EA_003059 [Puccinia striiformis f. sp. tritici]KAI7961211.1 hypothetical protein MJO28_001700 [Puccinia striiformis f. sp. tritici]KAI7965998.1 hypothetical protein MJO29_001746 [Puccinia striiformis f.
MAYVPSSSVFKDDIFRGKVLFCTGGGTGICQKMVEAVMLHGASAFIFGRRENVLHATATELSKNTLQRCSYASGDVRSVESLAKAVAKCISEYGRIDFVIAGAAGNFLCPIDQLSSNAFKSVVEIDLLGTYNTIKATLPHVKKTQGSFISVSATLHYFGTPLQAHVSSAKAGVDALSQALAVEFGPHGIRSNVIAPGLINDTEGFSRLSTPESRKIIMQSIPLQRFGTRGDIANVAVFLFSPAASYITGTILICDGGEYHTRTASSMGSYGPAEGVDSKSQKSHSKL